MSQIITNSNSPVCPHGFFSNDCPVCGTQKMPTPELPPMPENVVPFAQPEPDAKTKEMWHKQSEVLDAVGRAVSKAKSDWLDKWCKKLMPSALYALAKTSKRARHQRKAAQWMAMNQIRIQEHPDKSVLIQADKPLSEFRWRVNEGKLQVKTKDYNLTSLPPAA